MTVPTQIWERVAVTSHAITGQKRPRITCAGDGQYKTIRLDVVLPVLHGKTGEDGAMQGLLEFSGIPYAGCDIQSSAVCMDKSLAYAVVRNAGIATPNFRVITADEKIDPEQFILSRLCKAGPFRLVFRRQQGRPKRRIAECDRRCKTI